MADNVRQKNKIFSMQYHTKIPYGKPEYIQYGNGNTAIDCTQIQNTTTQLLQNDLFIRNQFNLRRNFKIGPKDNDSESIYLGDNGYKVWVIEDTDPFIYRKVEYPIQQSLEKHKSFGEDSKFVHDVNGEKVLIAAEGKTYVSDSNFQKLDFTEVKVSYNIETSSYWESIELFTKSSNESDTMFSFHSNFYGYGVGAYRLSSDSQNQQFYVFEPLLETDTKVTALDYEYETGEMFYAIEDGIYWCKYNEYQRKFLESTKIYSLDTSSTETQPQQTVTNIRFLKNKYGIYDILITTSRKEIKISIHGNLLVNSNVKSTNYKVNSHCVFNGNAVLMTTNGIFIDDVVLSGTRDKNFDFGTTDGNKVNCIASTVSSYELIEFENINAISSICDISTITNGTIRGCHYIDGSLMLITDQEIYRRKSYYSESFDKIYDLSVQGELSIRHTKSLNTSEGSYLYVTALSNNNWYILGYDVKFNGTISNILSSDSLGTEEIFKLNLCTKQNRLYYQQEDRSVYNRMNLKYIDIKTADVCIEYDGRNIIIPNEHYMSDRNSYVFVDKKVGSSEIFTCGFNNKYWLDSIDVYNVDCKPNYMYFHDNRYYMSFTNWNTSANYLLSFDDFGYTRGVIDTLHDKTDDIINNIIHIDGNNFLLYSNTSILNYNIEKYYGEIYDYSYCVLSTGMSQGLIGLAYKKNIDGIDTFYTSVGQTVLSSNNTRSWGGIVDIGDPVGLVNNMLIKNPKSMLFTKSSPNELWFTDYKYEMVNDTPVFTEESAYALYEEEQEEIDQRIDARMQQHVADQHYETSAIIKQVNGYTSTKFEIIDDNYPKGIITLSDTFEINLSNDYIEKMFTGNERDENILCWSTNSAVGFKDQKLKCNYITKCWKSGLVEIFINIPTTMTFYIPHIPYAGNCKIYPGEQVKVNSKLLYPTMNGNHTTITVNILSTFFSITDLMENTIKGTSLPRNIYKDSENYEVEEGLASHLYHTFMEPSVAEDMIASESSLSTEADYYNFKYYSFGTDEQNIRIQYFDRDKNYNKKYKYVVYHGRGVKNKYNNSDTITQRILEGDSGKPIYTNSIFVKTDLVFLGWSQNKKSTQPDFQYTELSYDMPQETSPFRGERLDLYAIWLDYKFSDDDTKMTIDNGNSFQIGQIEIDPELIQSLGSNVLIDWDRKE